MGGRKRLTTNEFIQRAKLLYNKVLINDNIKNEFAKQNNIKLLRISFTELEKIDAVMGGIV